MIIVLFALSYDTHNGAASAARKVVKDVITIKPKHIIELSKRILRDISCPLSWGIIEHTSTYRI